MDFLDQYSDRILPEPNSGCWFWTGQVNQFGYGRIRFGDRSTKVAHRASYEAHHNTVVPESLQIDHLCRVRCCVNPDHLEPVTPLENVRRGVRARRAGRSQTHCVNGHERTVENTRPRRGNTPACRQCARISVQKCRMKPGYER